MFILLLNCFLTRTNMDGWKEERQKGHGEGEGEVCVKARNGEGRIHLDAKDSFTKPNIEINCFE